MTELPTHIELVDLQKLEIASLKKELQNKIVENEKLKQEVLEKNTKINGYQKIIQNQVCNKAIKKQINIESDVQSLLKELDTKYSFGPSWGYDDETGKIIRDKEEN